MTRLVTGVFHDRQSVTEAVEVMLERGVPVDEISVVLLDEWGSEIRTIPVSEHSGTTRGAVVGGTVGAFVGALGVGLAAVAVALVPGLSLIEAGPILTLIVGGSAIAGAAMGAPMGAGRWDGMGEVSPRDVALGSVLVSVHSDDLARTARRILKKCGGVVDESAPAR